MIKSITNVRIFFIFQQLKYLKLTKMELTRFAMKLFMCIVSPLKRFSSFNGFSIELTSTLNGLPLLGFSFTQKDVTFE